MPASKYTTHTFRLQLALGTFCALRANASTKLPVYNKAAFNGQGDRYPESEWIPVNQDLANPVRVVLFEGWSVGFRALSPQQLKEKYDTEGVEF